MLFPRLAGKLIEPSLTLAANGTWIVPGLDQGNRIQEGIALPLVAGRLGFIDQSYGQK
jgi:hypothetical protein